MSTNSEQPRPHDAAYVDGQKFIKLVTSVFARVGIGLVLSSVLVLLFYDYVFEIAKESLQTSGGLATETELIATFMVAFIHCALIAFAGYWLIDYVGKRLRPDEVGVSHVMCVLAVLGNAVLLSVLIAFGEITNVFTVGSTLILYLLLGVVVLGLLVIGQLALSNLLNFEKSIGRKVGTGIVFLFVSTPLISLGSINLMSGLLLGGYAALSVHILLDYINNRPNAPVLSLAASVTMGLLAVTVVATYRVLLWLLKALGSIVRFIPS